MKKILFPLLAVLSLSMASCIKPDSPELDSKASLSALKCYVYYDPSNLSLYKELDLLSGMYLPEQGAASFTFPSEPELYNEETLSRCRIEATVPSTARVELVDADGNTMAEGLGGWHNLYNTTFWFNVIAADGTLKMYQISCNCKK